MNMNELTQKFIDELFVLKVELDFLKDKLDSLPYDGTYVPEREELRLKLLFEKSSKLDKVYQLMIKYDSIFDV